MTYNEDVKSLTRTIIENGANMTKNEIYRQAILKYGIGNTKVDKIIEVFGITPKTE